MPAEAPPLTITAEAAARMLEVDPDPAGDGYRLDHPDAVMTTFC